MKKKPVKEQPAQDPRTTATEQTFNDMDGRVIARRRDVLMFELAATDEHLLGLRASVAEAQSKKLAIEARIAGLNRVIEKRR